MAKADYKDNLVDIARGVAAGVLDRSAAVSRVNEVIATLPAIDHPAFAASDGGEEIYVDSIYDSRELAERRVGSIKAMIASASQERTKRKLEKLARTGLKDKDEILQKFGDAIETIGFSRADARLLYLVAEQDGVVAEVHPAPFRRN